MYLYYILITILAIVTFLIIWQFIAYPLLMAMISLKGKPLLKDYSYHPFVTILVPTFNEESVIRDRITNLKKLEYPDDKYEIIVVDSGSTDRTKELVKEASINCKVPLKLITEDKRRGKASAINYGKKSARGDIILVTDANTVFTDNVLNEMIPHFKDPKVGAVGGRHVLADLDNPIAQSNQFYLELEYVMRSGEAVLDSACLFHGEINAWRKELGEADTKNLSEDLDMAIQIRRKGYKVEYEPSAIFDEPSPSLSGDLVVQKRRTSTGTIQNIFKHISYWIPPKDYYSLLIFPSHKALPMFSPFLIIAVPVLYLLIMNLNVILTHLIVSILTFSVLYLFLNRLKSKLTYSQESKSGLSLKSFPKIIYYVLLNEYIIMLAWKDYLSGKYTVLWQKAETTR